ncbi:membrane alanyl aminopeptidase-like [Achroia grisella]|uniref:membrane alanyl aminopeptidase-like n=1 Tax=Achroia grisella TaxID=688607 RepID=UPI0027D28D65|nr:membrane alanyl aminopeptidase-like [Achroia grisella]
MKPSDFVQRGFRWLFLLAGIALIQGITSKSPIYSIEEEWETFNEHLRNPAYRLPTSTKPHHYVLTLEPYFENAPDGQNNFTFNGNVNINLEVTEEDVTEIVLHCKDMTIHEASVETEDAEGLSWSSRDSPDTEALFCDPVYDFLRINPSIPLLQGRNYTATVKFTGNIQTGMSGFYRSFYNDTSGRRWMGTTQFQPGNARLAFPCYDEPGFKSSFDITIVRDPDFKPTLSNTPIKQTDTSTYPGKVAETFYTTPYTSTYLLAFIVSHYERIASNNDEDRPFHIYARDNAGTTGDWSLEIGLKLLDAMEEFTDINYYDMAYKLDMKQAAIPDFSAGAMENWGLLTYREALILYDPLNSNHFYKQRVANIVSHEVTHMWFGNLVTCAWWDNLWLNEGFARHYQYYLTGHVEKDLGYDTRFIVEQLHQALFSDSDDNTAHPLTNPTVNSPSSVSSHFSTITYAKGACILRMTRHLMGEEPFRDGLRLYLKRRAFDVAEPHDLFNALDEVAVNTRILDAYNGITIEKYFETWTLKAGYPLLTVTIDQRTGTMIVTQARWERESGISRFPSNWHVPITWTRGGDVDFKDLKPSQIITNQANIIERGTSGLEWVIFNKQQAGFYRVTYDDTNWALITRALRSDERLKIHEYNRAMIVDDVFALARAGRMRYERAWNILSFLEYEDEYAPWIAAISGFNFLIRRLASEPDDLNDLYRVINELSEAVVERLGYEEPNDGEYMDDLLRMYVMRFLCNTGQDGCINAAKTKFAAWIQGEFHIPANLRPWVYCVGLRTGTAEDFDLFWERYIEEDLASEKAVMIENAGCTTDQDSLEKFLFAIVSGNDDIRPQDYTTAYNSAVTGNEINTLRVFEWLKQNYEAVDETFGSLQTPLNSIANRLLTQEDIAEFETWLDDNREIIRESVYNNVKRTVETTRSNLAWTARRLPEFTQFFEHGFVEDNLDDILTSGEVSGEVSGETTSSPEQSGESSNSDESSDVSDEKDSANIAVLSTTTLAVTIMISMLA